MSAVISAGVIFFYFGDGILGGIGFLVILIGLLFGLLDPGALTCTVPPRRALPWICVNSGQLPPECGLMLKVFMYCPYTVPPAVGLVFALP